MNQPEKIDIKKVSKDYIVDVIIEEGCDMLKGKMDGTESKKTIVKFLKICKCPVLKEKFTGIE